jgi:hypothetical protein
MPIFIKNKLFVELYNIKTVNENGLNNSNNYIDLLLI